MDKKEAGEQLLKSIREGRVNSPTKIGSYRGFEIQAYFDTYTKTYQGILVNESKHYLEFGNSALGNITRLDNLLEDIPKKLEREKQRLKTHEDELVNAKEEIKKPFAKAEILTEKRQRLNKVNKLIESGMKNKITKNRAEKEVVKDIGGR